MIFYLGRIEIYLGKMGLFGQDGWDFGYWDKGVVVRINGKELDNKSIF